MVELALLALMHLGYAPVIAVRSVAAGAAELEAYLEDPAHERELLAAAASVRPSRSPGLVSVQLAGRHGELWVTWILTAGAQATEVTAVAQPEPRGMAAQLAQLLCGRRRLTHLLDHALDELAAIRLLEPVPPPLTGEGFELLPAVCASTDAALCG
jgi:hypothetical protein